MKQNAINNSSLSRIIPWAHDLLAEVVRPGNLVVDLTAGRGQDTLALWQMVGDQGQVIAFDIQSKAIAATQQRLTAVGAPVRLVDERCLPVVKQSGIDLVETCHSRYVEVVCASPVAIIANLGYLPGGDQCLITQPKSTLVALQQALESLVTGGRMAVVVYPGHSGGLEEAVLVGEFFSALNNERYDVLQLSLCNRHQAPGLFVVEKRFSVEGGIC